MPTLLPNPPPMSGLIIRILCSGRPATIAYSVRWACGAWVLHQMVSFPVTLSMSATAPQVSSGAGWTRGIQHVLLDHDFGLLERGVGRRRVAGLPVEDVVVGLAVDVVADHRSVRVQGLRRIDNRRQYVVVHVDQREGIACGVAVFGDDERHLLPLESDFVGRENRDDVMRERRNPRELQTFQQRARDNRLHLGVGLGGRRVD